MGVFYDLVSKICLIGLLRCFVRSVRMKLMFFHKLFITNELRFDFIVVRMFEQVIHIA